MFLATSNEVKQVLLISYIGQVVPAELARGRQDGEKLLAGLRPGFRVLADFGRLEAMDTACAAEIGRLMELLDQKSIGLLVRVMPDASKDIGMDILANFHYRRRPLTVTCKTMEEAAEKLAL